MSEQHDELTPEEAEMLSKEFRIGTPSYSEWQGFWRFHPEEAQVSDGEYEEVFQELDRYCRKKYQGSPKYTKDFYVRGDNFGDRTQSVEIKNPAILDLKFVQVMQKWLGDCGHKNWRIGIPPHLTNEELIIVYPSVIRISPKYEGNLEEGIRSIASQMRMRKAGNKRSQ